jgi:hypothetical protein
MTVNNISIKVIKGATTAELDDIASWANCEATGEGTLMVDTDALDDGSSTCKRLRAAVGEDYKGLIWVTK